MNSVLTLVAFIGFAAGMWVYVAHRVAQGGWADLVPKYSAPRVPFGKKLGAVSGWFPRSRYQSSLAVWLSPDGLFIRPMILFRGFHPALLIPWTSVTSVSEEKEFMSKWTVVELDVEDLNFLLKIPGRHESDIALLLPKPPNKRTTDNSGASPLRV